MNGGTVCYSHGGAAPQTKAKAAGRYAEQQAAEAVGRMKIVPVDNPLTALGLLAGEMVMVKDRLAGIVDRLADAQLRSTDDKGSEQIRGELAAFMTMMNSCSQTLGMIAKLNIDERLARITEQQRNMIVRAIEAALAHAGVAGPKAAEAKIVAARHLRVIPGGKAA